VIRLKNTLILFLIAIVAISTVSMVSAKDITIGPNTPGGLKKAIDTAKNGDTIILTNGVYKGKNNRDIAIKKDIKIIGKGSNVVLDGEGKYKFLKIDRNKVSLTKIKFRNGFSNKFGGAIESNAETLTVSSCIFTNNKAKYYGGAIYSPKGRILTVSSCTFTNNQVEKEGGGAIYKYDNKCTVDKSTFTNNKARYGGAVYISRSGECTIGKSTFTNNSATSMGGAIYNKAISMKITDSNFKNNLDDKGKYIFNLNSKSLITKNVNVS